jgi:hypothetical protein
MSFQRRPELVIEGIITEEGDPEKSYMDVRVPLKADWYFSLQDMLSNHASKRVRISMELWEE